jgi:multicomponent Na+:H+ antiporter subunit G
MRSVAEVLIVAGATFVAIAGIGVVRFRDLLARMHAATKAGTAGIVLIAAGAALALDRGASKVLLTAVVLFVTAPAAAHLVGRAAYRDEGIDVGLDGVDELEDDDPTPH